MVQVAEVAATAGLGLDDLEDALLLQAELLELKASCTRRAEGIVIEAKLDKGQGPVATVVVKRGTLQVRKVAGRMGHQPSTLCSGECALPACHAGRDPVCRLARRLWSAASGGGCALCAARAAHP